MPALTVKRLQTLEEPSDRLRLRKHRQRAERPPASGVNQDVRVMLKGLQIGRVRQMTPQVFDSPSRLLELVLRVKDPQHETFSLLGIEQIHCGGALDIASGVEVGKIPMVKPGTNLGPRLAQVVQGQKNAS